VWCFHNLVLAGPTDEAQLIAARVREAAEASRDAPGRRACTRRPGLPAVQVRIRVRAVRGCCPGSVPRRTYVSASPTTSAAGRWSRSTASRTRFRLLRRYCSRPARLPELGATHLRDMEGVQGLQTGRLPDAVLVGGQVQPADPQSGRRDHRRSLRVRAWSAENRYGDETTGIGLRSPT
jgi:hypothetical protein